MENFVLATFYLFVGPGLVYLIIHLFVGHVGLGEEAFVLEFVFQSIDVGGGRKQLLVSPVQLVQITGRTVVPANLEIVRVAHANLVGQVQGMVGRIGLSYRIDALDFQRLPVGVVIEATGVNLGGIVGVGLHPLPFEIGRQIRIGPETQVVEAFPQAGGVFPHLFLLVQGNPGGTAVLVQGVLEGNACAGGKG